MAYGTQGGMNPMDIITMIRSGQNPQDMLNEMISSGKVTNEQVENAKKLAKLYVKEDLGSLQNQVKKIRTELKQIYEYEEDIQKKF